MESTYKGFGIYLLLIIVFLAVSFVLPKVLEWRDDRELSRFLACQFGAEHDFYIVYSGIIRGPSDMLETGEVRRHYRVRSRSGMYDPGFSILIYRGRMRSVFPVRIELREIIINEWGAFIHCF